MKVLVTGANGFVGQSLVPRLAKDGHEVVAAVYSSQQPADRLLAQPVPGATVTAWLDVLEPESVATVMRHTPDAVVHLAAIASVPQAAVDPGHAWEVNAAGTARLAETLARQRANRERPLFLLVSTAEVYGAQAEMLRRETDAALPRSAYAASKLGAEIAVTEIGRRTGLRAIIARAFGHTGPRQDERFVTPAFVNRILEGKRIRAVAVGVGNLEPIREFMHVDDVVNAYAGLLQKGRSGEVYNVASGRAISLRDLFLMIGDTIGYSVIPEVDAALVRPADIPYLVGDASKLQRDIGWAPQKTLEQTIREVIDAQAN